MTFKQWFFGGIENPRVENQWGTLHILTLVISVVLIVGFYLINRYSKNKEKTRKIIILSLAFSVLFLEVASRVMYIGQKYYYHMPIMDNISLLWIILPKPWCAISCWAIFISVAVNKKFFYNFTSISALFCALVFFAYPGVGFNSEHILFDNLYSIVTHALLLITSITLITLKFTDFRYKDFYKFAICLALTFVYGIIEVFILKIYADPMYFMPNGDIQAGILNISYGLYMVLYIALILVYTNTFYLIQDRVAVKNFFKKLFKK